MKICTVEPNGFSDQQPGRSERKAGAEAAAGSVPAKLRLGLVCNRSFHEDDKWVVATTGGLVRSLLNRFDARWIQSQADYENAIGEIDLLISMEPGWAAPKLDFQRTPALAKQLEGIVSFIFYSDPHQQEWREDYFLNNRLDRILAFYDAPTRRHFRRVPPDRIIHFPWTVPDGWISGDPIRFAGQPKLMVFGAANSDAYTVRNWCRGFPFVESSSFSGVENKVLRGSEVIRWLAGHDAVIAAGSDDPKYRLTTPKYFEIAAAGSLLFAQETDDLEKLGFRHLENCVVFNRDNFEKLALEYLTDPERYVDVRQAGRELVRQRHSLGRRLDQLEAHILDVRNSKRTHPMKSEQENGTGHLTSRNYWDGQHESSFRPSIVNETPFSAIIEKHLPRKPGATVVEIGAYPGSYLCDVAKRFGYQPTAIEFSEHCDHIDALFKHNGVNNLRIINEDFFKVQCDPFDVVMSFGFIEHFEDYESAIHRHFEFVKPGGHLVLSVPRLDGFQGNLRKLVYTEEARRRIFESHNQAVMSLAVLRDTLESLGLRIVFADHVQGDHVWLDWRSPAIRPEQRWLVRYLNEVQRTTKGLVPSDPFHSPSILIIAEKPLAANKSGTPARPEPETLRKAVDALQAGNLPLAADTLKRIVDACPKHVESRAALADVLAALNQPGDALKALSPDFPMPEAAPLRLRKAKLLLETGAGKAAEDLLLELLSWFPDDQDVLGLIGRCYKSANKSTEAAEIARLLSATGTPPAQEAPSEPARLPGEFVEKTVAGLRFQLDPSRYIDRQLLDGGMFEAGTVDALKQRIQPGMVVMDVGANFGYYTLLFSDWTGPHGRVLAFEPTAEYGLRLRQHVVLNNLRNVHFSALGLSDATTEAAIQIGQCSATLHWAADSAPRLAESIQLVKLDDWWREWCAAGNPDRLDLVKVDIDGHEPQFLKGATETLARHRPILLLEVSRPNYEKGGHDAIEVLSRLENELGYEVISGDNGQPYPSREALLTAIQRTDLSCNLLCLPKPIGNPAAGSALMSGASEIGKPTLFIHQDAAYRPDQWFRRFAHVLERCEQVKVELIDLMREDVDSLAARVRPGDALIGRFGHRPEDLARIRPAYEKLHALFEGRIFPKRLTYALYDDKVKQQRFFEEKGYPAPRGRFVSNKQELESFINESGLDFPIVVKQSAGAGSSGVTLAQSAAEASFPCLVQEFCPDNLCDWRINVIGHRVMGFVRFNRDRDFRASGSGRLWYPAQMPRELVELAARISRENGFESMAYDFVRHNGEWRLLEISYAYQDNTVADCAHYYDANTGQWIAKPGVYPEDYILEDFLNEHYGITLPPQPVEGVQVLSRNYVKKLPRILLIADVPDWIFEKHCRTLAENLRAEFDFDLAFNNQPFIEADYDLIYALEFNLVNPADIRNPSKYVTGIRSHLSWTGRDMTEFGRLLSSKFQKVHVVSQRLLDVFAPLVPGAEYLTHGVDTSFFQPTRPVTNDKGSLRVGWAGNRNTSAKGFAEFIKPLGRLPGVELVYCGYVDRNLNREEMRGFYDDIDVYVCSSATEGNNNSLMEAAAMERALVTTDTGTVPEFLVNEESALIVPRTVKALVKAVERLRDDPALRVKLGKAARLAVQSKFEWSDQFPAFRDWFKSALEKVEPTRTTNASRNGAVFEPTLGLAQIENQIREALAINPDGVEALRLLAGVCLQGERWVESANAARRVIELRPDDIDALSILAKCFFQTGDIDSTRMVLERILTLDPANEMARDNLATLGTESLSEPDRAGKLERLLLAGREAVAAGNVSEAIPLLESAAKLAPQDADLCVAIADLLIAVGDIEAARRRLSQALTIDANHAEAGRMLVELALGDFGSKPATGSTDARPIHAEPTPAATGEVPNHTLLTRGPLVSVIVPTCNRPDWLRETLESILAQTYRDFEIILVNDAGADVSHVVAGLAAEDRIRLINHEANKGLAGARNTGVRSARGKYIAYLDDDDIFHSDHLAVLVTELENSDAAVAYSDAHRATQELRDGRHTVVSRDVPYSHDFDADRFLVANYVPVLCFLHERRCFDETGFFDESLTTHEDWDLWMRMSRKFSFRHVAKVTCEFRWRNDGSSMSSARKADFVRTADIIYRKYPEMTTGRPDIELRRQHHLHAVSNSVGDQSGIATPLLLQVSIVIPVFNKLELTRACLDAVHRETAPGTFETIVVDNGSTDGTAEFLAAEQTAGRLRTIRNEHNLGFSKACNQGIRAATGGFVLLLNNDTVPLPGWLDALLGEAVADANIGAVGSCLLYPDGERIQHAGVTVGAGKGLLHPYHVWRLQRLDAVPAAQQSRDRQVCTGACLLIRRPVLDQVGLLDEGYVNGFEDVDLCFRIGAVGHRIRYCAASRVLHHESMTPGRKRHEQANYRRLNERWGKLVQPDESNVETALNIAEIHSLERLIREPDNHCALALLVQVAQRRGDKANAATFTKRFNAATNNGKNLPVTISIVIPVLNNLALTRDCLTGINRAGGLTPLEIIVVDNASNDGTAEYLNEQHRAGNLRFIRNAKNEGFARACNQGAALARGRFVLFLNNDTVPTAGWLDALWQASLDPAVGAVGARLLYADGTLQHAGIGWINGVPDHPLRHQSGNHPEASQFRELDMVTGACLLVPRNLFLRLGGFDECYINGVEDIDLCLRVRAAGHKVVYQPDAVVYHLEGKTAGRFDHVSKNLQKFTTRWKGWFDQSYRFLAPAKPRFIRSEKTVLPASTTAIPSTDGKLRINWVGSFLDHGSLSNVNRALTDAVERAGQTVGRVSVTNETPANPSLKKYRSKLSKKANDRASVTVRHSWPPNWSRPDHGKLAVIQPWEFGALPVDWVKAANQVDEFWVPSAFVRELYVSSGVAAAKVKVLPNGVDVDRFHPKATPMKLKTDKTFKFLFVGGTIFRKGPDLLLKAYLESFTAQDDVCLVIKDFGGDSFYAGQTIADSIREAQKNPDAPEILYLDRELSAEGMPGLYTACDCLVLPYRGEGFGLPVLEAMACGLPVVVTAGGPTDEFAPDDACYRIPSTRQVFGNQVSGMQLAGPGWLLEPNLAELQSVLKRIVAEPDVARARGRHGTEHVRHGWTWNHSAAKAIKLASALAGNPTAPATRTQPRRSVELPPVARIGHLGEARELVKRKQWKPAWDATQRAIEARPFHPEAWLTLAEIASNTGNGDLQKECVDRARTLAPAWKRVKEFTKQHRPSKSAKGIELTALPKFNGSRLSVCLITKNEEQFLGGCLQSIRDVADQIVVVDTGSTDRTIEIAREHGAEVHDFTWCDDFSAARNAALTHATGDWVLMLDADEELDAGSVESLRRALTAKNVIGCRLPIVDTGREAEGCTYVPRLFRNAPGLFYICRVHEQVFSSVEARRQEWNMELGLGEARLIHHGYTEAVVKDRNKIERNLRLLEKAVAEMPDEPNLLMNYGLELVRSGELERGIEQYEFALKELSAKPAAEITPEIRETLLTQMGSHYLKAKRWDSIVELYDSPLSHKGGLTASMHFTRGLALQELGRWADSVDHFRQAVHKRNDRTFYLVNELVRGGAPRHCLANSLWKSGDHKGAEKEFEKALHEAPELAPLKLDHARFLADTGRTVDALKQLNGIVAQDAANSAAWLLGAEIALSGPELLEFAFDWTGEAVRLLPANRQLQVARARTLVLAQRYADALPLIRELNRDGAITAEQLLCELMRDEFSIDEPPANEREISHAFLQLYRRLVQFGCAATVEAIHERMEILATLLPSAAAALREVLDEVATAE